MTHYEERLEQDLGAIRDRVAKIAVTIEEAVRASVNALLTHNLDAASQIILGDMPINREIRAIDALCHAFVARHLPSAGHLRFVSSVLRLTVALERIGDYAVTIGRETAQLSREIPGVVKSDIELIADQARHQLRQAMDAFNEGNAELARGTKGMSDQIELTFQKVFADLIKAGEKEKRPIRDLFALLVVVNRLGRVSDQAKNICEEAIFSTTGETKTPKRYRILFLDERGDGLSQLARAYAQKAFPESGEYSAAGWSPAEAIDPQTELFLDQNGYDVKELEPTALPSPDELNELHVIVGLEPGGRDKIDRLPFHTIYVDWPIDSAPSGLDQERSQERLRELYQQLAHEIRGLIETLRGDEAS